MAASIGFFLLHVYAFYDHRLKGFNLVARCISQEFSCPYDTQAVQALYLSTIPVGVSAVTGGGSFSLTSADVLSKTFDAAIASFNTAAPAAPAGTGAGGGGRRLAQTTAAAPAPSLVRICFSL